MADASIRIRLTPRSGRNEIARWEAGVLHVRVAAPPVDGAANASLIELLADRLHLPRSNLNIVSGAGSRYKKVDVDGISAAELDRRIRTLLGA